MAASLPELDGATIADIGCGTGIQGLVAAMQGASEVHCCDIHAEDLALSAQNFQMNDLGSRLRTHRLDVLQSMDALPQLDAAVFNLPFIAGDVSMHADSTERGAVSGGDGTAHALAALEGLSMRLKPGGRVYFTMPSTTNVYRVEAFLDEHFHWSVVSRPWMPWRFFEIARKPLIDELVRSCGAYYRIDQGVLFEETRIVAAISRST